MTGAAGLSVSGLSVSLGRRLVVDRLDLPPLLPGSVSALIGPNGAGKSTVLRALAQIVPSKGAILWNGRDIRTMPSAERVRTVGYMPQAMPLGTDLTAIESVIVALRAGRFADDEGLRAARLLERLGLAHLAVRPIDELSGGERQMASLAQAMACEPKLLILDEPTSALDLSRQWEVMNTICAVARTGVAVLLVLHDLALAANWADTLMVLHQGGLAGAGAPSAVLTPQLLRTVYSIDARVEAVNGHLVVVPEGSRSITRKELDHDR